MSEYSEFYFGISKDELRALLEERDATIAALQAEVERYKSLINTPHTDDFIAAVRIEAAHQQERWGTDNDGGKTDADWFWLVGYLAGKALSKPEKQLHHIITTAAACLNWHAHKTGAATQMRPGIEPPSGETSARIDAPAIAASPELADKKALVLYFNNDEDRDYVIAACREAMPNARTVKIP